MYVHVVNVLGHIWTNYSYLLLVYLHAINVFRSCINILFVFTVSVRSCKNRLFLLTVGVLSCYHCFQVVYGQVILIESWCAFMLSMYSGIAWTNYPYWQMVDVHVINGLEVVYEQVILIDSWCKFKLLMFSGSVWAGYSYWQLVYVHVINVLRSCMSRLFLLTVCLRSCYQCFKVEYEQDILIYSWCAFMLSIF